MLLSLSGSLSHPGVSPGSGHWGYQQHRSGLWDAFLPTSEPHTIIPLHQSQVVLPNNISLAFFQCSVSHQHLNFKNSNAVIVLQKNKQLLKWRQWGEHHVILYVQVSSENVSQMEPRGDNTRPKGRAWSWLLQRDPRKDATLWWNRGPGGDKGEKTGCWPSGGRCIPEKHKQNEAS